MPRVSRQKRQLNEARKKSIALRKTQAAVKKMKLDMGIETEQLELIEDSYHQPSDFDLPIITEVKTEYIDEDFSQGVHLAPI